MMEHVDRDGQEAFIWAMRNKPPAANDDDVSMSWRDRALSKSSLDNASTLNSDESESVVMCKTLAAFVPDEVIVEPDNYEPRQYEASIMYGQISGLNELYQEYSSSKNVSCSTMTQIINNFLGAMIQEMLVFCGDVVQLDGETILCMWKTAVNNNQTMGDCVHQATDCALSVQKTCGSYVTDIGVTLKLRIAIVCGDIIFKLLGNEDRSYYIVYGPPILDVKLMQKHLHGGEIVISKAACRTVNMLEYIHEMHEEKGFAKILGASPFWRTSQRNYGRDDYVDFLATGNDTTDPPELLDLRSAISLAARLELADDLRKFIPTTMLQGLDMDEPIEYFTEMRNIVVTYIDVLIDRRSDIEYLNVVDDCYTLTEKVVGEMDGSINKIMMYKHNCTFLVIFGLRGFRHLLESKRALACATKLDKKLRTVNYVGAVTISVTTGMTYCSAIGHMLRRDYSVMSMGVNIASLLIDAYPDKITCDKATFLQSKLDPIQFVLQEANERMHSGGPIYQYVESSLLPHQAITQYPLLDREVQLGTYTTMLETYIKRQKRGQAIRERVATDALVIYGRPKEGKTRLTEEYLFSTPNDVPMFRMKLIADDETIPYQALYFMFCVPLGIREYSSVLDRQARLVATLKQYSVSSTFCALNSVFRVNFSKSIAYGSMSESEKFRALSRMIKCLCYACFNTMWVIIIDGGENMDDESWSLMKTLIDSGRIFLVITVTSHIPISPICDLVLKSEHIRSIKLTPIDKWFHVGIACQFLNVSGIPAEVEKVLHNKSKGNPGWIESYLITLIHSGALKIKTIPIKHMREYGLVFSPTEMVTRLSQYNLAGQRPEVGFKFVRHSSNVFFNIVDKWRMYKYSFKDSTTDIGKKWAEGSTTDFTDTKTDSGDDEPARRLPMIDICVTVDAKKIDDIDAEASIDSISVKILDYLNSYDQLLLKACSVIGETLSRDMLHYLMDIYDFRKCALSIKRMFDVGVLGCARGKFSFGSNAILNPPTANESGAVECRCEGLIIPEFCQDLPRYASCGYIYFKIEDFRKMTYTLLTVYQKNEFHYRAISYLEKRTHKCIRCGGGVFTFIGKEFNEPEKKKKITTASSHDAQKKRTGSHMYVLNSALAMGSDVHVPSIRPHSSLTSVVSVAGTARSFSSVDFTNCDCTRILYTMYKQLVMHTEAVGQIEKWLFANLEYGRLCIETCNIPLAIKVLNESLAAFNANHHLIVKVGESWRVPFINATILVIIAKARMEIGQLQKAFTLFCDALNKLSFSLPSVHSLKYKLLKFQQYMYLMYNKRYGLKAKQYLAEYCNNVAECLNNLCVLFIEFEMFGAAEVPAVCSLKMVLTSERDFVILINAFTNIIKMYVIRGKMNYVQPLEVKALDYCKNYSSPLEVKHLEAIAYLYTIIFKARIWRCELNNAVAIGNNLVKIINSLNRVLTNFDIYPLLVQVLIFLNRITDAIAVFSYIEKSSIDDMDYYDLTWYYALCVCFHLETGYTVMPFEECENYRFSEAKLFTANREPTAQKRYYVVIWLWLLRNGRYEDAEMWESKIDKVWQLRNHDTLINLFTALYYLEGLILQVVFKIDKLSNFELRSSYTEIGRLFGVMQGFAEQAIIIAPRLYHLKAFYLMTTQEEKYAYSMLARARRLAVHTGNIYEENWIKHSEQAWKQDMPSIDYTFWTDHAVSDNLSYTLLEANDKFGFYTMEPPIFK